MDIVHISLCVFLKFPLSFFVSFSVYKSFTFLIELICSYILYVANVSGVAFLFIFLSSLGLCIEKSFCVDFVSCDFTEMF